MAKPYMHWDPSLNGHLYVRPGDGPLIVDADNNADQWENMVAKVCRVDMFGNDLSVDYLQTVDHVPGTAPTDGLRVRAFQYMPQGLAFFGFDPNGEPYPFSQMDPVGPPYSQGYYMNLGWRMQLRGFLGSFAGTGLAADFQAGWHDAAGNRNPGDTRGAWTGHSLRVMVTNPGMFTACYYHFANLHGKKPAATDWQHFPTRWTLAGIPPVPTTAANGISGALYRLVISGGTPSAVDFQVWGGLNWVTLWTDHYDLTSLFPPFPEIREKMGIRGDLFAGSASVQPVTPVVWPTNETWFYRMEMSQFEPFVIDKASWGYRDWDQHWRWLSPASEYLIERRLPQRDLIHHTPGVEGGPTELRVSDDDLGICMQFNQHTYLRAETAWDRYGVTVTQEGSPAVCAENSYGYQAPFAMLGRFKFQNMEDWTQTMPCDIMTAGLAGSGSPESYNAMQVYWEYTGPNPGQGKLVARARDTTAMAWVDVEFEFNAIDWDDRPVDIAFCWSGARGTLAGRPNFEWRLVVNGMTRAVAINPDIRLLTVTEICISSSQVVGYSFSPPSRRSFQGMFREAMVFADPMSDQDLRKAWDDTAAMDNPSFEIADPSGRPGEAEAWTWDSEQAVGAWAGFNEKRIDLLQWATAQEGYEAGWHYPHTWAYADEAERLAAIGFTADDVGGTAWQRDDDTLWLLTNYSPITWVEVELPTNEAWEDVLDGVYALFNEGVPLYEGTMEQWAIGGPWPAPPALQSGPPWLDGYNLVAPWEDDLGPLGGPTGFNGWYDFITGTNLYPLSMDDFGEAWGTDPLSTSAGPMWYPGAAPNGRLYGQALTEPVTIVHDRRWLTVYMDYSEIAIMELTPGDYTVADLAIMLQTAWDAQVGGSTGVMFGMWTRGSEQGVWFGWDGSSSTAWGSMFARREQSRHNDARMDIGFDGLGPNGSEGAIVMPAAEVVTLPGGIGADENFLLDGWSFIDFSLATDPYISGEFSVEYGQVHAIFGSWDATPDPTVLERFTLVGWFGAGAVWKPEFTGPDLTAALFNGGSDPMEQFVDTDWPDNLFP